MRAACRKFLLIVGDMSDHGRLPTPWSPDTDTWIFKDALGELRAISGLHVGQLSSAYSIDIEDDLATILPAETGPDDHPDEDEPDRRWSRGIEVSVM